MEMGEDDVDKSKKGIRRKNKVGEYWGLHGTLWCGILCSSVSCSVSWRQLPLLNCISKLPCLLSSNWYQQELWAISRNSGGEKQSGQGVYLSAELPVISIHPPQATVLLGVCQGHLPWGLSWVLRSGPTPQPLWSTGTKFSTIASRGTLHHTLLISLILAHTFLNVPSLTCLKFHLNAPSASRWEPWGIQLSPKANRALKLKTRWSWNIPRRQGNNFYWLFPLASVMKKWVVV